MGFSNDELNDIYDKTNGYCEYCGKKIAFVNYGQIGARGAWEVDHSNPRSRGGTNYMRNLVPSCIPCNRDKSNRTGTSYRASWRQYRDDFEPRINWGDLIIAGLLAYGFYRISLNHSDSG